MHDIFVPALGHAMEECVVIEWLKQPGDHVADGEDVVAIETDKSTVEVASEVEGILGRHRYPEGARVPVGEVLAYVLAEGEAEPDDGETGTSPVSTDGSAPVQAEPLAAVLTDTSGDRHRISPRQRRLAAEAAARATDTTEQEEPVADRSATAAAVTKSWQTIPQFSVSREVRGEAVLESVRAARERGVAATVTDVLLMAFGRALSSAGIAEDPSIGLAVATANGVAIPVIARPGSATIDTVAALRAAATDRARQARSTADDAIPVTATVSNLGRGGVSSFTGVVPLGQTLLLTAASIRPAAVVEAGQIGAGQVMTITLNIDHRAYDGTHGAALLGVLAQELEGGR